MNQHYGIILRPIISEKSTALAEVGNRYVFEVARLANKEQIRDAVENLFSVNVREVRTLVVHGKTKRAQRGGTKEANWKKAIVTLSPDQKIDFFQAK